MTFSRAVSALAALGLVLLPALARAAPAKVAVFDLELLDMSQEGAANGIRADETQRLALASNELRQLLRASDQIQEVDLAPQAAAIRDKAPLFKCNGCADDLAKALGADLAVSGHVE
jgi:hypothetical protein